MRYTFLASILFWTLSLYASQPWMEPGMEYFKMKVADNGIYEISANQIDQNLSAAGFNAQSIDPAKWAIFYRGREISILLDNGSILFYGRRNNADLDTGLYFNGGNIHPFLNSYNDSSAYFLSWYQDSRLGKRISQISTSSAQNVNYHFCERRVKPQTYLYYAGQNYFSQNNFPLWLGSFQSGETWGGVSSGTGAPGNSIGYSFDSLNNRLNSVNGFLEVYYVARGQSGNSANITLNTANPQNWNSINTNTIDIYEFKGNVSDSHFEGDELNVNLNITNGTFMEIGGFLYYPQAVNLYGNNKKQFILDSTIASEISISISDAAIAGANDILTWDITELYDIRSCQKAYNSGSGTLLISTDNADQKRRKLFVEYRTNVKSITDISYKNYQDLSNPDQDLLLVYPEKFDSVVSIYANYRQSSAGGNYNPLRISIDEVYDQFSYGELTPVGIHELARYMHYNSTASSNYLFLIGNGLVHLQVDNGFRWRFNPEQFSDFHIPTFGFPGGDWPYTMNFDTNNPAHPAFGVGRLNVKSQAQVLDYLEKVVEFEDPDNNGLWRKELMHISGGNTSSEIQDFYGRVNNFKDIAEGPFLGANVETISKQFPNTIQNVIIDSTINRGISLLTMYGHSGVNTNDINIGDVNDPNLNYNNGDGKYPMFIINGCLSGNIFVLYENWTESWINTSGKGASLMLAHTHSGFHPILSMYTEKFYETAFADSSFFGKPVGDILTESSKRFYNQYHPFWSKYVEAQNELMLLQGDPCIRLSGNTENVDYAIKEDNVAFHTQDNSKITSQTDSFAIEMRIENYGKVIPDSVNVLVKRVFPSEIVYEQIISPSISYADTLTITIDTRDEIFSGLNEFEIHIDPDSLLNETNRENNYAKVTILIPNQDVINVSPANYGIVSSENVKLRAAANLIDSGKFINYVFELDTSYLFDSPFKKTIETHSGVYADFQTNLLSNSTVGDSLAYYWRTRRKEDTVWSESSFTNISNSAPGWTQGEYGQLITNDLSFGLNFNESNRELQFADINSNISVVYGGIDSSVNYINETEIRVNGVLLKKTGPIEGRACVDGSILMVQFDPATGLARRDYPTDVAFACGIFPSGVRQFLQGHLNNDNLSVSMYNALQEIPEDDYVLMFNYGRPRIDLMSDKLIDSLALYGLDSNFWAQLDLGEPFLYFGRKHDQNPVKITGDSSDLLNFDFTLVDQGSFGKMTSGLIGPSSSWINSSVFINKEANDSVNVNLFGRDKAGKNTLLKTGLSGAAIDLSDINASQYPYLFLESSFMDSLDFSSAQLNRWIVIYEGSPEGVLDPLAFGESIYDSLSFQEGALVKIPFCFRNISEFNYSDSLIVNFSIGENLIYQDIIQAPMVNDSVKFDFMMPSIGKVGNHLLRVFVNPYEQTELSYDNNILEVNFEIFKDQISPLIFATFDGQRISNNDYVAFNTEILMSIADENPFFTMTDSNSIFFNIYEITDTSESLVPIVKENIIYQLQSDSNDFSIKVRNDSLVDGRYKLQFNGRDASGNLAGPLPQIIEFRVQEGLETAFDGFNIYPNPFTREVYLSFDISGSRNLKRAEVEFHDLRGRRIFSKDLKPQINVGNNRIQLWDGKNFRNQTVPSGIYIYKVGFDFIDGRIEQKIGKLIFQP